MSMSRGCVCVERERGRWYCAVASAEHDYDFRRYTVYGPAASAAAAFDLMHSCEANPGAHTNVSFDDLDQHHKDLIDRGSRKPTGGRQWSGGRFFL